MLLEHDGYFDLNMDALAIVCSWNTNGIMVWAWMRWSSYALGTRTELWFGHGCSGHRMLSERERNYGLGMDALVIVCSWNTSGVMVWAWMLWSPYALRARTELWFGHGCSGHRVLLEHERNYGLGMDALAIVCSWNTIVITAWAWMLWSPYALGTRTELWFGHGCSGHRMLLERERNYGLGMDALVIVCSRNTNEVMVWAWMLWSSYALRAAPHGGNAFPLRTDPGASPASKKSCWNLRTQGPRGCVPPKTSLTSFPTSLHFGIRVYVGVLKQEELQEYKMQVVEELFSVPVALNP